MLPSARVISPGVIAPTRFHEGDADEPTFSYVAGFPVPLSVWVIKQPCEKMFAVVGGVPVHVAVRIRPDVSTSRALIVEVITACKPVPPISAIFVYLTVQGEF
jgi:hypothetical protein